MLGVFLFDGVLKNLVLIVLFVTLGLFAEAQVQFIDGSFDDARSIAIEEGKGMFLDFYAEWCVPCKQMEKYGFQDKDFTSAIESRFIAVKVDVDMFVGMDMAEEYKVDKYPTLILTDMNGNEVLRREGYQTIEQLNEFVKAYK